MRPATTLQGKKRRSNINAIISGGMNFNQESFKLLAKKIGHSKQTRNLLERPGDTNHTTNSVAKGQLFKSYLEANIAPPIKDLPRQINDSTQMISTNFETSALSRSQGRNSKLQTMRSRELKNLQLQLALQSRNQTMLGESNPYNQTTNLGFTESPQAEQRSSLEFRQRNLGNLVRLVRNSKSTQKRRGNMGNQEKYKTTTCIMNPMRELARLKQLKGMDTARQSNGPPKNETFAQILGRNNNDKSQSPERADSPNIDISLKNTPKRALSKERITQFSNFTRQENLLHEQRLGQLEQVLAHFNPLEDSQQNSERAGDYSHRSFQPNQGEELKNINCQELLLKTQKDLKNLMYKANKLVSSDNQHVLLERNERLEFEIIEGTSLLLKIEIQTRVPPLKLYFDYLETASKKGDLTVCFSRRVKHPQLLTSEKVYHRPKLISLDTADPFYLQQYLYIGLYSEQGCQFGVKAAFPKDEQGGGQVRTRGAVGESVSNAYGTKGSTDVAADEIRRRPGGVNQQGNMGTSRIKF